MSNEYVEAPVEGERIKVIGVGGGGGRRRRRKRSELYRSTGHHRQR